MKKIVLWVVVCLFVCGSAKLQAQRFTKKVAITEVIDKEQKVNYSVKLMLRESLASAITRTKGYEGIDRVNVSSILDEQSFQRAGLVNEDDIKRLGQMSGADYILVAEVVKIDNKSFYITAKLLNVETAKLEKTETTISGNTPKEVDRSTRNLAKLLFNEKDEVAIIGEKKVLENGRFVENGTLFETDGTPVSKMSDDAGNYLKKNGQIFDMNDKKFNTYMEQHYFGSLYKDWMRLQNKYKAGKNLWIAGVSLAVIGGCAMGVSGGLLAMKSKYSYAYDHYGNFESDKQGRDFYQTIGNAFLYGGGALLGGGLCTVVIGTTMSSSASKKMSKMYRNGTLGPSVPTTQCTFGIQNFGTGFALKF